MVSRLNCLLRRRGSSGKFIVRLLEFDQWLPTELLLDRAIICAIANTGGLFRRSADPADRVTYLAAAPVPKCAVEQFGKRLVGSFPGRPRADDTQTETAIGTPGE